MKLNKWAREAFCGTGEKSQSEPAACVCMSKHSSEIIKWGNDGTVKTNYRVAQNHGKQALKISCIKFHLPTFQFVVIPNGKRDLSSLPEASEAAVQISWKKEAVGPLIRSFQGNSIFPVIFSKPLRGFVRHCTCLLPPPFPPPLPLLPLLVVGVPWVSIQ